MASLVLHQKGKVEVKEQKTSPFCAWCHGKRRLKGSKRSRKGAGPGQETLEKTPEESWHMGSPC